MFIGRLWYSGVLAILRGFSEEDAFSASQALIEAGISTIEITADSRGAWRVIESLKASDPRLIVGAGTVLDSETTKEAIQAGADFLFSPIVNRKMIESLVRAIAERGASSVIIPAMGSHGGATAEGQKEMLLGFGICPENLGVPIISSMEVTQVGTLADGLPVFISSNALKADGIVLLNRIKPHTAFRGTVESGLIKMLTIGLGKQKGAEACHAHGFKHMARHLLEMGTMLLDKANVLFGLGVVENAYDEPYQVAAIPGSLLIEEEPPLLEHAKNMMLSLPVQELNVLVIDEIGKDISGDGMDPNITGRYPTPYAQGGPEVSKMVLM